MKRGFTLVELLGVAVLLALVMALSYPSLFKIFNDKQDEIDLDKKQIIENTAINYVKLNINDYPYKEGKNACLFLKTLIDKNKLSDNIYKNLENRIIKIDMINNNYKAQILGENETCTTDGITYEVKTCTKDISTDHYTLSNTKTNYYKGTQIQKQINKIEGKNIDDLNTFNGQTITYRTLNDNLNSIQNIASIIDIGKEYFMMQIEITNPEDVIIPGTINNSLIVDTNTSKIKTTC